MELKKQLNECIDRWALLRHPFYQAWESGELSVAALKSYASEYGAFISLLPLGWETIADEDTANEEREHIALWQQFAYGLDTEVSAAQLPAVADLVAKASALFGRPEAALGAMYAFEAQQPATAKSKLDGLRKHYNLPGGERYFLAHANNQHEAAKLLEQLVALPAAERTVALDACEQMSAALWNALTDIYDAHKQQVGA
ncbi:MAG: iron-containing redox enzyme family protein [Anaerolineales bacterium]